MAYGLGTIAWDLWPEDYGPWMACGHPRVWALLWSGVQRWIQGRRVVRNHARHVKTSASSLVVNALRFRLRV